MVPYDFWAHGTATAARKELHEENIVIDMLFAGDQSVPMHFQRNWRKNYKPLPEKHIPMMWCGRWLCTEVNQAMVYQGQAQ